MTPKSNPESSQQYYLEDRARKMPELQLSRVFFPDQQLAATVQLVLHDELRELALLADPGVAMTKIGWWHEEWQRLLAGQPRHPVTTVIAEISAQPPPLERALAIIAEMVSGRPPEDKGRLDHWLERLTEPFALLEPGGRASRNAWRRIWLLGWLADLATLTRNGRAPWSLDLAASTGIVREQAGQPGRQAEITQALWNLVDPDPPEPGSHAQVYAALREQTALRAAQNRDPAGKWRQLWVAWRTARKGRRAG